MKLSLSRLYMEVKIWPTPTVVLSITKTSCIKEPFEITSRIFRSIALVYGW